MPTLGTPHRVVNKFWEGNSPVPSMTCEELHRFVQELSTSLCFVSNFETEPAGQPASGRSPTGRGAHAAPQHPHVHMRKGSKQANQSPMTIASHWAVLTGYPPPRSGSHTGPDPHPKQQPPLVKGAPRQRRGIGSPGAGAEVLRAKLWGFFEAAKRQEKARSQPISRVLSWTVIPLGAASPQRSSNLPGGTAGRGIASLFGLAPGGVCRAGPLPDSRCALTAPFHPCLISEEPSAVSFCCTFRRLAPPRGYLAPCPVEPGLSSASAPTEMGR